MTLTAAHLDARLMVGMEIHVELGTVSKMFTGAPNVAHRDHADAEPNTLLDPVVLGMPGVLPVINREAVELSMLAGLALGCRIAAVTKWDRKSYYYPDLPKNYQISQYDQPLCEEGFLEVPVSDEPGAATKTIRIIRAHLEEDAGKLLHEAPGGGAIDHSIVDLNRAGTPLLEIVTYPDFETAEQVVRFAQMLRQICRTLRVSECIMQRGHMRFEPNINVVIRKDGREHRTPIVEIKNLNSFKALEGAVRFEYERQIDEFHSTGVQETPEGKSTRGWDDVKQVTFLQRKKEEAHDYRYFPDPDLVPLRVDRAWVDEVRRRLPELPLAREARYVGQSGLSLTDARTLVDDPSLADFFDLVVGEGVEPRRAAAILLNYGARYANERGCGVAELNITPGQVREIAELAAADKIGSTAAEELFGRCCDEPGRGAAELAEAHGMLQVSETGALAGYVDQVLADAKNRKTIDDIRAGKGKAIGALMGQIMKLSKGQANPKVVTQIIQEKIK